MKKIITLLVALTIGGNIFAQKREIITIVDDAIQSDSVKRQTLKERNGNVKIDSNIESNIDENSAFRREMVIVEENSSVNSDIDRNKDVLENYSRSKHYDVVGGGFRKHAFDIYLNWGYSGLVQDLGHLYLPDDAKAMSLRANSMQITFGFVYEFIRTKPFSLKAGLEFEFNNFRFKNNISLRKNAEGIVVPDDSYTERGIDLKKSKLMTAYLNIPIMVDFRIPLSAGGSFKRHLSIGGGVVGGWGYNTHTKVKFRDVDNDIRKDKYRDLNIPALRYGYRVQIRYEGIGVYAMYYPNSIFKVGEGPNLHQTVIGLVFSF